MWYGITDKYEELDIDLVFPKTSTFNQWLKDTNNNIKLLSMLIGCIDGSISERFKLDDIFFEALENEYRYMRFTLTKDEVTNAVTELVKKGYIKEL